jgi:hypothetical protein
MISIDIQGGLGNQLFMIFSTLAYGLKHNIKTIFSLNRTHIIGINRPTYWDTFLDGLSIFTTTNVDINVFTPFNEPTFSYSPLPIFNSINTRLVGYFQSYKYFEPYKNNIYKLINLSEKQENIINKYPNLFDKQNVSIHFRIGDYKHKRYYHPVLNYEYFEKSLSMVMENKPNIKRVLYFCESEDNDFISKQIHKLNTKFTYLEFIKVDDTIPDYEQMLIMSCCNNHIISNSTFSLWAAYMNQNNDTIVCYPSVWFGEYFEHTHDYGDMMMDEWHKIDANPIHWSKSYTDFLT